MGVGQAAVREAAACLMFFQGMGKRKFLHRNGKYDILDRIRGDGWAKRENI